MQNLQRCGAKYFSMGVYRVVESVGVAGAQIRESRYAAAEDFFKYVVRVCVCA